MNHVGGRRLPAGWRWVRLGDVCEIIAGQSPPGESYRISSEGMPFFQGKADFGPRYPTVRMWCVAPTKVAVPGDILISIRAPVGPTNIAEVECCIGRGLAAIRPREQADRDFILAVLRFYEGKLARLGSGSTFEAIKRKDLESLAIPLAPLCEQKRITAILKEQMEAVERARVATEAQLELLARLIESYLRHSLFTAPTQRIELRECLTEITQGVGVAWKTYAVVGATRAGAAPAKEGVGKKPERYKFVDADTIFYNPMRILLGSIGMIDIDDAPGITSPDYVVFKTQDGVLHPRWFYYWLRSRYGEAFIKTLTRGAVRERMLFKRLSTAQVEIPRWSAQVEVADKLRIAIKTKRILMDQLETINKLAAPLLRRAFSGEL